MTAGFPDGYQDLLRLQEGIVTRRQALASGLTGKVIEGRLSRGRWRRMYTGVYATFSGTPSRPAMLWAAVLRAGPDAVLSHQTAGELHGLADVPAPVIHVTVPSGSPVVQPHGMLIHYSGRLVGATLRHRGWPGLLRPCGAGCRVPFPSSPAVRIFPP